jgi:hypothetical protein
MHESKVAGPTFIGADEKGGVALSVLTLLVVGGVLVFVAGHHLVMTDRGLRVYPKEELAINDSYVDIRAMPISELRHHEKVIRVMARQGDLREVPGGEVIEKMTQTGTVLAEAMQQIDRNYHVSGSAREIGRIAQEKYQKLDERYDVQGKAAKANEKVRNGARGIHEWLEKQ